MAVAGQLVLQETGRVERKDFTWAAGPRVQAWVLSLHSFIKPWQGKTYPVLQVHRTKPHFLS